MIHQESLSLFFLVLICHYGTRFARASKISSGAANHFSKKCYKNFERGSKILYFIEIGHFRATLLLVSISPTSLWCLRCQKTCYFFLKYIHQDNAMQLVNSRRFRLHIFVHQISFRVCKSLVKIAGRAMQYCHDFFSLNNNYLLNAVPHLIGSGEKTILINGKCNP